MSNVATTTNLMQANAQWASRPDDERFTSLDSMQTHFDAQRAASREVVCASRRLAVEPTDDNKGLLITGPNGHGYTPTHHAFGQLATLAGAPAGYLRNLPSPIAADCLNFGLQYTRDAQDIGALITRGDVNTMRAATGPRYGRIWNGDIVRALRSRFGDGTTGDFRVPGIFGQQLEAVTKENTTLYAGDRDMFVFLADEEHRIEMPNRRNGETGSLARGFFVWNSEVGAATFGLATFLFDFVCSNRIVWGASQFEEIRIRHTVSAPDKFLEEMAPALARYAQSSTGRITQALEDARKARIDDVGDFLAKRFGKRLAENIQTAHVADEGRPIETIWDAATGITAHARSIQWQDERVALERQAGEVLDLATA
jgi:hypothetical protein